MIYRKQIPQQSHHLSAKFYSVTNSAMFTFSPDEILRCVSRDIAESMYGSTRLRLIIARIVPAIAPENIVTARRLIEFIYVHDKRILVGY